MLNVISRRTAAVLMVAHVAGLVDLVALPLWVSALVQHYGLDYAHAGLTVTLFLLGVVGAHPFLFGLTARLDPSGRTNALTPAMMMTGSAIAPAIVPFWRNTRRRCAHRTLAIGGQREARARVLDTACAVFAQHLAHPYQPRIRTCETVPLDMLEQCRQFELRFQDPDRQ